MWNADNSRLLSASMAGDVTTVQSCLARGVNINTRYDYGFTPLLAAMYNNHPQVVTILLTCHDLDITAVSDDGFTGLHSACYKGNAECIRHKINYCRPVRQTLWEWFP
jgi:ankyrin repeat protein